MSCALTTGYTLGCRDSVGGIKAISDLLLDPQGLKKLQNTARTLDFKINNQLTNKGKGDVAKPNIKQPTDPTYKVKAPKK